MKECAEVACDTGTNYPAVKLQATILPFTLTSQLERITKGIRYKLLRALAHVITAFPDAALGWMLFEVARQVGFLLILRQPRVQLVT